jgi:hypothetical protein
VGRAFSLPPRYRRLHALARPSTPRQRRRHFLSPPELEHRLLWAVLACALYALGIWIIFQPIEMRGTLQLGLIG